MSPQPPKANAHADGSSYVVMLLADGRLPVGGHTQSAGLEPALLAGLEKAEIPALLGTRLRTQLPVEMGTVVVTRHLLSTPGTEVAELDRVQAAWAARTPSEVVRAASVEAGRGWLRLLSAVAVGAQARTLLAQGASWARPVAVGALAAALGLSARATAALVAAEDLGNYTAACLKLAPLDPAEAFGRSLAVRDEVDTLVAALVGLTDPDDIPASAAPLWEHWQHAHPDRPRRLFRA